jgi:catalase (peroxidase I)
MALALIDNIIAFIDEAEEKSSAGKCPFTGQSGASCTRVTAATQSALRGELEALIRSKGCAPILVRLAWHDAGTFCVKSKTGGSRAAQRFAEGESKHGANAGLNIARDLLKPIQEKFCNASQNVSIADLWAFAGNTAIVVSGGPDIPFKFGRVDITAPSECVEEGRLPDGDKGLDHLRGVFGRMGFSDEEIVALSGAHTLGGCHADRSGFEGMWTAQPLKFDNSYFKDIVNKKWAKTKSSKGCPQLKNAEDANDKTMMLSTDLCLFERKETKDTVALYAKDEKAFFTAFGSAWTKLIGGNYGSALYTAK